MFALAHNNVHYHIHVHYHIYEHYHMGFSWREGQKEEGHSNVVSLDARVSRKATRCLRKCCGLCDVVIA